MEKRAKIIILPEENRDICCQISSEIKDKIDIKFVQKVGELNEFLKNDEQKKMLSELESGNSSLLVQEKKNKTQTQENNN